MTNEITTEQRKKIYEYTALFAGQELDGKSNLIIDTVIDEVLAYCNRDDMPVALERITAKIAANAILADDGFSTNAGMSDKKLTSYKEGDASWTWSYSATDNVFNEANLLENFRKIRSIGEDDENILD